MRLTAKQVNDLPNGTIVKLFYSGSEWDEYFGKVFNAIKINDRLYHFTEFTDIDDLNGYDGYEIEAAIKEKYY